MNTLAPCPRCKRHVAARETTCPFCALPLAPCRAQHAPILGRMSRAAVFSAALVACDKDEPPPALPEPPARGTDDLEQLLDSPHRSADQPDAPAPRDAAMLAPVDAGLADATASDAGVRVKKPKKKQRDDDPVIRTPIDPRHMAKPYGAPPARRRIV